MLVHQACSIRFSAGIIQHDPSEADVFLLIRVILDPLLFTLVSGRGVLVHVSLPVCKLMMAVSVWMCFSSSQSHTGADVKTQRYTQTEAYNP